ncbi:hypothetical protein Dsin_020107 [Dipteronia sinensis]|uniref:Uncharacterized protein n=1 Tax=Dipteronia sinensis TaxID=43782 RepID=A0AAE0A8N3_9ROSI|nr:hypothetical protein Dsin_020107 [Dipteronia sinensis]
MRSKLAWLCKELPALKADQVVNILDAARKWLRQEDATYAVVPFMRIGNYWAADWVYIFSITDYIIVKTFSSSMVFDCSLGFLDYISLNFVEFLGLCLHAMVLLILGCGKFHVCSDGLYKK